MALDYTPQTVSSGYLSTDVLNENETNTQTALADGLSRSGNAPNAMGADLDMNSNRILNLPNATSSTEPVTYAQWSGQTIVSEFDGYLNESQTATAGQTSFTTSNAYTPGLGALRVYINGVYQDPSSYTETDANTVTMSAGLDAGDLVSFVISSFTSASSTGSNNITYSPAGANAVDTNVQVKLREQRVSVTDFGAVGDGVTDDTTAIGNAIDWCNTNNKTLYIPSGTYVFNGKSIAGPGLNICIEGEESNRPKLICTQATADTGPDILFFSSTRHEEVTGISLASNITTNERTISVTDATGLAAGMMIHIASDQLWYNGHRSTKYCGEIHKISSVDGTTIYLEDFTRDYYDTGTDTLTIRAWTPNRVIIRNLDIEIPYPTSTAVSSTCIILQQTDNALIENVHCKGALHTNILDNLGWKTTIRNCSVVQDEDMLDYSANYAVGTNGSVGMVVDGLYSRGNRRGVDADGIAGTTEGAPTRDMTVRNSHFEGNGIYPGAGTESGVGPHGPCENIVIENCLFQNLTVGVLARGRNTKVNNCYFSGGVMDSCVSLHENATGLTVQNCVYDSLNYPDKLASLASKGTGSGCDQFIRLGLESGDGDTVPYYTMPITITGNVCKGLNEQFIKIPQNDGTVQYLNVRDNYVEFEATTGTIYFIYGTEASTNIAKSYIEIPPMFSENGGNITNWNSNITFGARGSDPDNVIQISPTSWVMYLPDDNYLRIQQFDGGFGGSCTVSLQGEGGFEGIFRIAQANATLTDFGGTGANVAGSATTVTGTSGTDGNVTLHLTAAGDLYVENRSGSDNYFRITRLG